MIQLETTWSRLASLSDGIGRSHDGKAMEQRDLDGV